MSIAKEKSENGKIIEKVAKATLKYLKIAPRKTRKVADIIKGMPISEAESELLFRPQRASGPILKLVRSAKKNAENIGLNKDNLIIDEIRVDKGPMLKRSMPRAKGRATMIQKKMSHIFLTIKEKDVKKRKRKAPSVKFIKSDIKK